MRVAVYGGSFDPPHIGHDKIVKEVLKNLDIERFFIVPTWLNPFKKAFFAPPKTRLQWVKKLWGDLEKVKICEYELKNKRPTSTNETIDFLYANYPLSRCYFIIGADNLKTLHKWDRYDELKQKVEFVVASRDNIPIPSDFKTIHIDTDISSSKLQKSLNSSFVPKKILTSVQEFYKEQNPF